MYRIYLTLTTQRWWRRLTCDRGEFGPMAYAVMVSLMVLLAFAVAAWGEDIAKTFMDSIPDGPGGE